MLTRLLLAVAAIAAATSIAHADVELKNDGFVSGGQATFQTGFVAGEAAGVRFTAPSAGRRLTKVQLLFGGAATTQTMTVKVYDDSAGTDAPGNGLYMGDVGLTGSDNAMQELDLTAENIVVPAQFRVVFEFNHAGAPSLAVDTDGIHAGANYIYSNSWKGASTLGVAGDWVVRAFVSDVSPDAGPTNSFCDTNAECGNGRYCDVPHHACTMDCQGDTDCHNGGHCDDLGQCVGGGSDDDGGCRTGSGGAGGLVMLALLALLLGARRKR